VSDLSSQEIIAATAHDKKVVAGTLHFVAATAIGETTILTDVSTAELRHALETLGIS
jgi:3-dehydroquinate synthetase